MPDILLTGLRGQLGSAIFERAASTGLSCLGTSRAELDIIDRAAVLSMVREIRPTVVVNAAAYTAVDRAESDAGAAFAVNRDGAANIAEACAAADIPLIHISTDYVFDGRKMAPYVEADPAAPLNVYGESKLAGENAVRERTQKHVILRTSWLYSPRGRNFVTTILRLARERKELRVVCDQFGSPTFAGDLADAVLRIASRLRFGEHDHHQGIFHCAGAGVTTWFHLAEAALRMAGISGKSALIAIPTSEYPAAAQRPAFSALSCRRLSDVYGINMRPWEAPLAEMLAVARLPG